MAGTIEEQNKLMEAAAESLALSRKKLVELSLANDVQKRKDIIKEASILKQHAKAIKDLHDEADESKKKALTAEINYYKSQSTTLKDRQNEFDNIVADPKGPLRSLLSNMNTGLSGGLKDLTSTLGGMFSETGAGKALNMGSQLLGKDGIRSIFEDPEVRAVRQKTEEEERKRKLEGLDDVQQDELERRNELGTTGRLTEDLFSGLGNIFGLNVKETDEGGNELLEGIESSLRGSPPYLLTISQTLTGMATDLRTVTESIIGQIDDSGAGRKEREFEAQKRHDELVEAQSEGGALDTTSPEIEIKGGGFLEKIGTNAGKGLKSIVDGIFGAIKAFVDGIGSIINAVLNIIKNFVNKVGQIIQKLAKIITRTFITLMKGLGKGIAALFKALGSIPPQAIGLAAAALGILTVSMIGMAFAMRLLAPLMETVAPVIIALVNGIVKVVKTLANLILEGIKTVVGGIIELSKIPFTHFARLAGGLLTLTPALFALGITGLIAGPGIAMVAGGLLLLGTALNIVAPAIQKIVPPLLALFEGLNRVMGSFLTTIVTAVEGIGQVIGSLITTFGSFITTFAEAMIRLGEADLFKIALGFMALAPALGFFGLMTTLAIPALLALGIAAGGLASLMSQDPERLSQMAEGFKILGGAIKGFAKSAYGLLPAVGILTALSAIPFAGKLIDLAIAKTESLNVTTGARENIISASNTNAELRDELVTTSSINQVNAISSSNIVNTSQNMFIKPQVRDIGLMSSRRQTTVHSIA